MSVAFVKEWIKSKSPLLTPKYPAKVVAHKNKTPAFDGLEKGLDVGVDVDDLVSEEHHDPAGLEGQPPQLVGGSPSLQSRVADGEPEHDPVLDGGQGQVSATYTT